MADHKEQKIKDADLFENFPGKPAWYYTGIYALVTIALFHSALFSPSKLLYGTDLLAGNLFFRHFLTDYLSSHWNWPVWLQTIHGGMPFVDGMNGDMFYLPTLVFYMLFGVFYAWGFTIALHVFLAGLFMYIFLKDFGIRGKVAFLFGLIYMLAPVFVSLVYAGHNGKIFVIALTPLLFFAFNRAITRGKLAYYILLSLVIYLVMTSPHMQLAYFLFLTLGAYFIVTVIRRWWREGINPVKPVILFTAAVVLGLMISLVQFLTPYQYLKKYSMRTIRSEQGKGYTYSTSWSLHAEEVGALFFPEFSGDDLKGQGQSYWGRNYFKLNSEHFSLIAILLSIFAVGLWRKPGRWFFLSAAVVTLIFSLGADTPFFHFFYLLPGINSFRAPSLISFITAFSVITLGAMGLEAFLQNAKESKKLKKTWKIYTYITIGFAAVMALIIVLQMGFFKIWFALLGYTPDADKMTTLRQSLDRITFGAIIALIIAGLLFFMLKFYIDRKIKSSLIVGTLAIITVFYMWHFDSRYISTINPQPYYGKSSFVDYFKNKQQSERFRVFVLPQTLRDYYLSFYGIEELSLTMLHGNHLATFEKLAGRSAGTPGLLDQSVQDLLDARYLVTGAPLPPEYFPPERFKQIQSFGNLRIYENLTALPRAFAMYKYIVMQDDNEILTTLRDSTFAYRTTLILDQPPAKPLPEANDTLNLQVVPARVYDIENDGFKVDVDMLADGFLFLGENYYPPWKAYENGTLLPTLKADYTFRAIPLPQGRHTIECRYENTTYNAAFTISEISFLFAIVALIGLFIRGRLVGKNP